LPAEAAISKVIGYCFIVKLVASVVEPKTVKLVLFGFDDRAVSVYIRAELDRADDRAAVPYACRDLIVTRVARLVVDDIVISMGPSGIHCESMSTTSVGNAESL